jgi:predicted nucleic acid-binding protein
MVFSYHLAEHPVYTPATRMLLSTIEAGTLTGITTTITLAELLTRPAQEKDRAAM